MRDFWRSLKRNSYIKDQQYPLVGPRTHPQTYLGGPLQIGEMVFPEDSRIDIKALHLAFFDHFLKGSASGFDFPRARIYVTGLNEWGDQKEYPQADMKYRELYLHSGGKANTFEGDGRLNWVPPEREPMDHFEQQLSLHRSQYKSRQSSSHGY